MIVSIRDPGLLGRDAVCQPRQHGNEEKNYGPGERRCFVFVQFWFLLFCPKHGLRSTSGGFARERIQTSALSVNNILIECERSTVDLTKRRITNDE